MDQHSIQLEGRTGMLRISASFFQPDMVLTGDIQLDHIIGFQVDGMADGMDGHENGIIDGMVDGMDGHENGIDGMVDGIMCEPDIGAVIGLNQLGMFLEENSCDIIDIIGLQHSADIIGFIIMVDSIAKK